MELFPVLGPSLVHLVSLLWGLHSFEFYLLDLAPGLDEEATSDICESDAAQWWAFVTFRGCIG